MAGHSCLRHRQYRPGCPQCQTSERHYSCKRRRAIANGTWQPQVPVATVRDHITQLRTAGMSLNAIARAANISRRTLYPIAEDRGLRRHVQGPTAAAILAVQPAPPAPPAGMVPAVGTGRRARALVAAGYSFSDLSRRLGHKTVQQVWEWANDRQRSVTTGSAQAVDSLYRHLSVLPGTSVRARNHGLRHHWPPPMAWDDDQIDRPDGQPSNGEGLGRDVVDEVLVQRAIDGDEGAIAALSRAEKVEAASRLLRRDLRAGTIARRLNVSGATANQLVEQAQHFVEVA
jgi:hypothetical protein